MKLIETTDRKTWPLIRFIAPAFPQVNIYTGIRITPLGLVNVATAASTVWGWRSEIIDENNYTGPRDKNGLPDHAMLQKENPAAAVGFYCGLTSTMDRVFELAQFYQKKGTFNLAGGWHAHYCPEEMLDNNFDIVVHGDGEEVIVQILNCLRKRDDIWDIAGISFWDLGAHKTSPPEMLELEDLSALPYPNFGLIRYAKKIKTYPIGRVRGCRMNCEFCSVKGKPRFADPFHTFNVVRWLVDTRKAKRFFIVDDRLDEDRAGLITFFELIREKYGARLHFTVQIRLEAARDTELLELMQQAGVRIVCVGFESPIDEDLKAMHKGLFARQMVVWTLVLRRYFWVHGMFIFGYPNKEPSALTVPQMVARFKKFIREAKISSVQVLHPVPLVGTELRARLLKEGRLFPRSLVPWSMYDGNYACFLPRNIGLKEFQDTPIKLMNWFYSRWSIFRIPIRTVLFPVHYVVAGWHHWHYGWLNDIVKYGGHRIVVKWRRRHDESFISRLENHQTVKQAPNS